MAKHRQTTDEDVRGTVRDYKAIRADYRYYGSMFSDEDEVTARLKWIIDNKLTQVEQTIILLYADCMSLRKLGRRLGLSHTLAAKEVRRIRTKILEEYYKK